MSKMSSPDEDGGARKPVEGEETEACLVGRIYLASVSLESFDATSLELGSDRDSGFNRGVNWNDEAVIEEEAEAELSFTSDTDNSTVAEAVVRNAIARAIKIVKADENKLEKKAVKQKEITYSKKSDGEDSNNAGDAEENTSNNASLEVKAEGASGSVNVRQQVGKDAQVGLFSYADMDDSDRSKSPEVSELDDTDDDGDVMESMNEEEKANIMKLYGLEDVGSMSPVSPKSASPDVFTLSLEGSKEETGGFIDVQRQVYEPQTRSFSVNRDPSSSESTPRLGEDGAPDNVSKSDTGESDQTDVKVIDSAEKDDDTQLVSRDDSDKEIAVTSDKQQDKAPEEKTEIKPTKTSISPPLVQYESVTENGKFRIIKTPGSGGIRVGNDVFSPKDSPKGSPKDAPSSEAEEDKPETPAAATGNQPKSQIQASFKDGIISLQDVSTEAVVEKSHEEEKTRADEASVKSQSSSISELDRGKISDSVDWVEDGSPVHSQHSEQNGSESKPEPKHKDDEQINIGSEASGAGESSQHMSLDELQVPATRSRETSLESESRYKYTSPEQPFIDDRDRLSSDSRYMELQEQDPLRDRDRYTSDGSWSNQHDLASHSGSRAISGTARPFDTGVIPGFKTLQQQQMKWSDMFKTLEEEHRRDMRSQYERHQYNIQRLQQQMEHELQKQHQAIRKKLDIHKEALAKMSPETESRTRRLRSPDGSPTPEQRSRSPDLSDRSSRSTERERSLEKFGSGSHSQDRKTWREIYREVREEEEEKSVSPSSRSLRRSLDADFDTLEHSRSLGQRSSPHELSRSGDRERSLLETSPAESKYSKADRDRSLGTDKQKSPRQMSPRQMSPRQRSPQGSRSQGRRKERESPAGEGVSRHVKELLDSLNDSRHSMRGLQQDNIVTSERPRAGVYSSPMPIMSRAKTEKSVARDRSGEVSVNREFRDSTLDSTRDPTRLSYSLNEQSMSTLLPRVSCDSVEMYEDDSRNAADLETSRDSTTISEDSYMSQSARMNLREKHAKHLADLRAYYEDELRELRKALSSTLEGTSVASDKLLQSTTSYHLLQAENKHQLEKTRSLEDQIETCHAKQRALEQKNTGIEKRASEYASAFADAQSMAIQHRAHIEELQRYCRERDDLINDLESRMMTGEDNVKIYKKNMEEEQELHRQDKIALQRMMDRYDSVEREYKLLQETMTTTENKWYETRTEVVDLNRTIAKLELENKRLGRENDNLRYRVTQSLNVSSMHESFGSPVAPRESQSQPHSAVSPPSPSSSTNQNQSKHSTDGNVTVDRRLPGFATSLADFTQNSMPSHNTSRGSKSTTAAITSLADFTQNSMPSHNTSRGSKSTSATATSAPSQPRSTALSQSKSASTNLNKSKSTTANQSKSASLSQSRLEASDNQSTLPRQNSHATSLSATPKHQKVSKSRKADDSLKVRQSQKLTASKNSEDTSSSKEDVSIRQRPSTGPELPARDITPPRSDTPDSEVSDYSPLLKAERELFKLRDMMRNAVSIKPAVSPPPPKLQKKFYGNERPDDYTHDLGASRGRKERNVEATNGAASTCSGVEKSKSSHQVHSKSSPKADKSSSRRHASARGETKSSKSRDKVSNRDDDRRDKGRGAGDESAASSGQNGGNSGADFNNSSTRFDIDINENRRSLTVTPRKGEDQARKQRNLAESGDHRNDGEPSRKPRQNGSTEDGGQPENTLEMMRGSNQHEPRHHWDNKHYTTEAQDMTKSIEQRVGERMIAISAMESRYDGLQAEKRQLESNINKVPLHGRVDRQNRRHKEEMEDRLEDVVKELGSLRMSLKRYNVLKTAG